MNESKNNDNQLMKPEILAAMSLYNINSMGTGGMGGIPLIPPFVAFEDEKNKKLGD